MGTTVSSESEAAGRPWYRPYRESKGKRAVDA